MQRAEGRAGLRALLARMRARRVQPRWVAVAILAAPLTITATLILLSTTDPAFVPAVATAEQGVGLVLTGVLMGLVVGTCEELGWTGFAVPRLRQRLGVLPTGVVLGIVWGLWHLPLFSGSAATSGVAAPGLYLLVLLFSFLVPFRTLMVWVHDHTHSLWIVILMHAPLAAGQLILVAAELSAAQMVRYDLALAGVLWGLVGVIALTRHGSVAGAEEPL